MFPPSLASSDKAGIVVPVQSYGFSAIEKAWVLHNNQVRVFHGLYELQAAPAESLDVLVVGEGASASNDALWASALHALVPGGTLFAKFPAGISINETQVKDLLVLSGFVSATTSLGAGGLVMQAARPSWKPALALPLAKKKKKQEQAWELVDEESLLEDDCAGTLTGTGNDLAPVVKKKACKNCSCGLKELESAPVRLDVAPDNINEDARGCGSCAKGDAFRCGDCPYLGLPTFTPGTKPEIVEKEDGSRVLKLQDYASEEVF
jgi:hypothetical protein